MVSQVRAYFWFFVAVVATDIALSVFVSFSVDLTASHYDCEVCQFLWANQLLTYFIGTVLVFVVPATWLSMYLRAYSLKTREQAEWNDLRATSSTVVPYQPPQLAPHPDLCAADSVWLEWVLGTAPQYGLSLSSEKDQRVAIAAAKAGLWNVPNSRFRQLAELDSQ